MGLKKYKPTSPGRRGAVMPDFDEITKSDPEKSLLAPLVKKGGRNNKGRITVRHRGGGHKRRYRLIDYYRDKSKVPARVLAIEYDPNRTARIALVQYEDGEKRYVLAPEGISVGDPIANGDSAPVRLGNALKLCDIPSGTHVHNVELVPGDGGKLARGAGSMVQVLGQESGYALLRLPSGEIRRVRDQCMASIGQVGNIEHKNIKLGKAGRKAHRGRRPSVRGLAMTPRDHPHGGGEGKSGIGMPGPKTPWGKPALGHRTRSKKTSDRDIVRRRYQR